MTHAFIKKAGVKTEEEFYRKYPTEEAFFKDHPTLKTAQYQQYGQGGKVQVAAYDLYEHGGPTQPHGVYWDGQRYRKATGSTDQGGSFSQYGGPIQPVKVAAYDMYENGGFLAPAPANYRQYKDGGKTAVRKEVIPPGARIIGYADYDVPYISYPGDTLTDNQIHAARNNRMGPNSNPSVYNKEGMSIYKPSKKDIDKMNNAGYNLHDINRIGMYGFEEIPAPNTYIDHDAFNPSLYRDGGIHIKPENRGKFNATKKATGKTTEELTHSSNPVTRKRAIFAQNAKHFKHEYGGPLNKFLNGGIAMQDNPDMETQVPQQPYGPPQAPYTPPPTGLYQDMTDPNNMSMPGTAQQDATWRAGMTDEQAQANINAGSTQPLTAPVQHRRPIGNGYNNLLGAGLMAASFYNDKKSQRDLSAFTRGQGMSSNVFGASAMNTAGNKGDYTANDGYFRPSQNTPAKPIAYGRYGGQYADGGMVGLYDDYNDYIKNEWPSIYKESNPGFDISTARRRTLPANDVMDFQPEQPSYAPTTMSGAAMYSAAPQPMQQRAQQGNWHTDEDTNYSIDAVRAEFGGYIEGVNGNSPNVNSRWNVKAPGGMYGIDPAPDPYQYKRTLQESDNPDIIVEKQEAILGDFNGDGTQALMKVDTGTHASGNDQGINVPDNAFVFSDTKALKIKDKELLKNFNQSKPKTPAQIAKQYDLQKFTSTINNPKSDNTSRKTAQLMIDNYTTKLGQLAALQEGMKEQKDLHNRAKLSKFGGYADGGEVYNGNVKKMNPDGTIDHNYYEGSGKGTAKGKGRVIPKGYRKGEGNFRFDQTAADPYTGNIPGVGGWDNVEDGSVPGTDAGSPTPNNMNTLSIGDNIGTTQSGSTQPTGSGQENRKQGPRFDYSTPDKFAIANSLYNAANLHKYMPWEAPVSAVTPDVVFMDPTRALAANSEQANSAQQVAALSGNNKAARANSSAIQGQGAVGAANIIGDYNNRNVAIANQAGEQYANITNQLLQQKAARANRLYQGTVTANQQYDNSSRDARADIIGQYSNAYKNRAAKDSINQTNQYYYLDNQDRITFRTPDDETAYRALMSNRGVTGNNYEQVKAEIEKAMAAGFDEEDAYQLVTKNTRKERTSYDKNNNVKSKSVTQTKNNQYGGYTHSPLAKFFRNKEGK